MSASQSIKVILVDKHPVVLEGLRLGILERCSEACIIGNVSTIFDAEPLVHQHQPHVMILGSLESTPESMKMLEKMRTSAPHLKIVLFSQNNSSQAQNGFENFTFDGILPKSMALDEFCDAMRAIVMQNVEVSSNSRTNKQRSAKNPINPDIQPAPTSMCALSPRELEVLKCIGNGLSRKQIADELDISVRTVDRHRQNVMDKLNIHREVELAHFAFRNGLVDIR